MRMLRYLFNLFWIPCCALAMLAQTRALLDMPLKPGWMDVFVFGATLFGYHFNHAYGYYRLGVTFAGLFGAIAFVMVLLDAPAPLEWALTCIVPLLFWLAYYGVNRTGKTGLRSLPLAKPLAIGLAWAWVGVLLPLPAQQWPGLFFMFLGRAAFLFVLALGYDLADLDYDRRHGLRTLVGQLGVGRSFTLIYSGLAFGAICVLINYYLDILSVPSLAALFFSLLFSAWWLHFLLRKVSWVSWQKVLIDGLMVLQCMLVVLSQIG